MGCCFPFAYGELPSVTTSSKLDLADRQGDVELWSARGNLMLKHRQSEKIALVLAIWQKVFRMDYLTEDADFFALGGDSLKAMRIISLVGQATGKQMSIRMLFDAPTLKQFVRILEDDPSLPPYTPIRSQRALRLDYYSSSGLWIWLAIMGWDH
jgi:acyl carrier protein